MAARGGGAAPIAGDPDPAAGAAAPSGSAAPRPAAISGEIANRADVVRMLDKLIKYYHETEPSSPLPMLLERARRLVPKNCFEIMEDLAPDGMSQLMVIKGPDGAQQD